MTKTKIRITWNGMGGELDSTVVESENDWSVANALIKLIQGEIVSPGDSFTIDPIATGTHATTGTV